MTGTNDVDNVSQLIIPIAQLKEERQHKLSAKDAFVHAFEGPEKLLEMWFCGNGSEPTGSLRDVKRADWEEVLDLVHCTILSEIKNNRATAYLLSESSFFVFDDRVILKTCGTTTLLGAVPELIRIAKKCGLGVVEDVFYSRQNFFFPQKQISPHTDFRLETEYLDGIFEGGCAYKIGRVNGAHYNFYNAENRSSCPEPDATIEVLMSDLDQDIMRKLFYKDTFTPQTSKECGIHDLLPGALIDEFIFDPYGYSMNGIRESDGTYCTIHVTPQKGCSYASFETNACMEDYTQLIKQVLAIFNPGAFLVTTVVNDVETGLTNSDFKMASPVKWTEFSEYRIGDRSMHHFQHYDLTFMSFSRKDVTAPAFSKHQIKRRETSRASAEAEAS